MKNAVTFGVVLGGWTSLQGLLHPKAARPQLSPGIPACAAFLGNIIRVITIIIIRVITIITISVITIVIIRVITITITIIIRVITIVIIRVITIVIIITLRVKMSISIIIIVVDITIITMGRFEKLRLATPEQHSRTLFFALSHWRYLHISITNKISKIISITYMKSA